MINVTGLDDAAAVIADAMEQQQHLGVQAMATKAAFGRDANYDEMINVSSFSGIIDYQPDELQRAEDFGADILRACVEMGGVLTGEHGVGVEKRDLMGIQFTEEDMKQQQRLKCAFDADHLLNPGKVFPHLHRCAELGRLHVHKGKMPFPDLPRF